MDTPVFSGSRRLGGGPTILGRTVKLSQQAQVKQKVMEAEKWQLAGPVRDRWEPKKPKIAEQTPNLLLSKVSELTHTELQKLGPIRGLVFDLDDTLSPYFSSQFYAGMVDALSRLDHKGYRLGVATNSQKHVVKERIAAQGGPVISIAWLACKPSPAALKVFQEQWRLSPEQIAVVGDSAADIKCAKRAGMVAIQVNWAKRTFYAPIINRLADILYSHWPSHLRPSIRYRGFEDLPPEKS